MPQQHSEVAPYGCNVGLSHSEQTRELLEKFLQTVRQADNTPACMLAIGQGDTMGALVHIDMGQGRVAEVPVYLFATKQEETEYLRTKTTGKVQRVIYLVLTARHTDKNICKEFFRLVTGLHRSLAH